MSIVQVQDHPGVPEGLLTRSEDQYRQVRSMSDTYVQLVAMQLLTVSPERLVALWRSLQIQQVFDVDPIIALARIIVGPIREARTVLRLEGGDVPRSIATLRQYLELNDPEDPFSSVVRDAIASLRCPQGLTSLLGIHSQPQPPSPTF